MHAWMLALAVISPGLEGTVEPTSGAIIPSEGLAISFPPGPFRDPFPTDPVADAIARGRNWREIDGWRPIKADSEGRFPLQDYRNGYLALTVNEPRGRIAVLEARGHSLVYVNGELRTGDLYDYGYVRLPVRLRAGENSFLFTPGRAAVRMQLVPPKARLQWNPDDPTFPDLLETDRGMLWAALPVLNSTDKDEQVMAVAKGPNGETARTRLATIPAGTFRKVGFRIRVPNDWKVGNRPYEVQLVQGRDVLDTVRFDIQARAKGEPYRRTFISQIDDSVQYYAVRAALEPSPNNLFMLSLHGAAVEAIGQASAYQSKEDITVVAPTNRRPFGFDWEDWGRWDALEVFRITRPIYPHNPLRVHLSGHSMGGKGTWHIGTLFPGEFASIAPAAGWVSYWTHAARGWEPRTGDLVRRLIRDMMTPSDPVMRLRNTLAQGVYVLHGDADEVVSVEQSRLMRRELLALNHPDFTYTEKVGGSHWWGADSMDWPPFYDMMRRRQLNPQADRIDFTTPSPGVSPAMHWVRVERQHRPLILSRVIAERTGTEVKISTTNIETLSLETATMPVRIRKVVVDNQELSIPSRVGRFLTLRQRDGKWSVARPLPSREKNPNRMGPFKEAFRNNVVLVYGTAGTPQENAWARARAVFDAENFAYRGNGSVSIVADKDLDRTRGRNVVLYGNEDTNIQWVPLLGRAPLQVRRGEVEFRGVERKTQRGSQFGALGVFPGEESATQLIGFVSGTGMEGFRRTDRLPVFVSGIAYPDWMLLDGEGPVGAGFLSDDWSYHAGRSAWRP